MLAASFSSDEMSASVITPYFEATRDVMVAAFEEQFGDGRRSRIRKARLIVDDAAHDTRRHFAMTHTESLAIVVAPQMADLNERIIVGILAHEFGHVADYAYPGAFAWPRGGPGAAHWIGGEPSERAAAWRLVFGRARAKSVTERDDDLPSANWMRAWEDRSDDEVEWAADAIAELLTGRVIGYAGPCMLQQIGGWKRPRGLR